MNFKQQHSLHTAPTASTSLHPINDVPFYILAIGWFALLPFSLAPKLFLGKDAGIFVAWRELLVFGLPLFALLSRKYKLRVGASDTWVIGGLLFLAMTAFLNEVPAIQVAIGLAFYSVIAYSYAFVKGLSWDSLLILTVGVFFGTAIGGIGLAIDYLSGFVISAQLHSAGLELIEYQTTSVKRTMFLYSGQNTAATYLALCVNYILMFIVLFGRRISPKVGLLASGAISLSVFGVFFTFSLAGYSGIILAFFPLLLIPGKRLQIAAMTFGGVIAMVLIFGVFRDSSEMEHVKSRLITISDIEGFEGESEGARIKAWIAGLANVSRNLLVGNGIGTGNTRSAGQGFQINHYESFPFAVANEAGLLGLTMGLFFFVAPFFLIKRMTGLANRVRIYLIYNCAVSLSLICVNPTAFGFEFICLAAVKWAMLRTAVYRLQVTSATGTQDRSHGGRFPFVRKKSPPHLTIT